MRTPQECQILPVDGFANTSYSSLAPVIAITNVYLEQPPKTCNFPTMNTTIALHN
jgi:hypothetical protein